MSLIQKHTHIFPHPPPNHKLPKPFDEALILRLKSLLLKSQPSISIPFLVSAVDLLSSTLSSFSSLISDPTLSRSAPDVKLLSSHLDFTLSLLDAVNSLSYVIDHLSRQRLHVSFALHLLSSKPLTPDLTCKARVSISKWDKLFISKPKNLIVRTDPRKASVIGRAIYAVEAVAELVVGLMTSALGGCYDFDRVRVSSEFCWAEAFNGVVTAVKGKGGRCVKEVEDFETSLTELKTALDDDDDVESMDLMEREKVTEKLMDGLDSLGKTVNGLFRTALRERNVVLEGFRISASKCK